MGPSGFLGSAETAEGTMSATAAEAPSLAEAFAPIPATDPRFFEAHWSAIELAGFTLVQNAMRPELLLRCRAHFDAAIARAGKQQPPPDGSEEEGIVGMFLDPWHDPIFAELFDNPAVLPLVERAMRERTKCARYPQGERATLLDMNDGQYMPAGCGERFALRKNMGWHPDGEYVRLTYILDDMEPAGGGTAFYPGSHRAAAVEGDRAASTHMQSAPQCNLQGRL